MLSAPIVRSLLAIGLTVLAGAAAAQSAPQRPDTAPPDLTKTPPAPAAPAAEPRKGPDVPPPNVNQLRGKDAAPATRPSDRPPVVAPVAPRPPRSMEEALQPDVEKLPVDPAERAKVNAQRGLNAGKSNAAGQPGRVVVEGDRPISNPTEQIGNTLTRPDGTVVTVENLPGGKRKECVRDCTGPACCVVIDPNPNPMLRSPLR
ncbi:MAG TPA: hypothetical protein VFK82_06850 [Burkholderiaceae bacterium]|nr:hypothetical protein [Burkholderiaceae bacterium]